MIERAKTPVLEKEITPHITSSLSHVVWGAIFAGAVIMMVVELLLSLLGAGIGLSAINPLQTEHTRALGVGAIIWAILSGITAFYSGGWVSARLAGFPWRTDGMLHGILTWGVSTLIIFLFLTTTFGFLIGAGVSRVDVPNDIQQLLQQNANQPQNIQAVQAQILTSLGALAMQSPQNQQAQKEEIVNILTANTNISAGEARITVDRWAQSAQNVRQGAATASDVAGKGAFLSFVILVFGAIAAGFGGWMGSSYWSSEEVVG